MGRIYDALRRAEQERKLGVASRPEPAFSVDVSAAGGADPTFTAAEAAREPERPASRPQAQPARADSRAGASPSVGTGRVAHALVALTQPSSPACDRLRAAWYQVVQALEAADQQVLVVTSAGRGEGKTTTAANLALLAAADPSRRVLLVEADLRRPVLASLFGLSADVGLSDVALGRAPWRRALLSAPGSDLRLVAGGRSRDGVTEALKGPHVREFLREAREAFDTLVVDAPPVLPVADAMVLAGLADAVLLVARARHTPREALLDAIRTLGDAKILGVVLNAVDDGPLARRAYYAY